MKVTIRPSAHMKDENVLHYPKKFASMFRTLLLVCCSALFILSSCKKNYACECEYDFYVNGSLHHGGSDSEVSASTKKKAKDLCDDKKYNYSNEFNVSCEIK